ncbi:MAG: metalloregulator ArsR/SmtB family transcription factor [Leptospiraceae bacterium]|nr:metalloregulator ArsR/SmtB family transcription factor [Leptospiraceae bacterium]
MVNLLEKKSSSKEILNSLKAVSDETRIRILNILSFGAFHVNEIVRVLGMGQSRISRHLKILSDAGLLQSQREGSWVYYKLAENTHSISFPKELTELLISYKEELASREIDQKKVAEILDEREKRSSSYFNQIGKNLDLIQSEVMNPEVYRKWVTKTIPSNSNLVLDLGCGAGELLSHLLPKATKLIGIDSSIKMIEEASLLHKKNKKVNFIHTNLENLPLKDKTADAIVASMVLHHISNPPLVIGEAHRILKPEGNLTLVDIKKHDKEFMRDKFADLWLGFEPELLRKWLEEQGFQIAELGEIQTSSGFVLLTIKANKKRRT